MTLVLRKSYGRYSSGTVVTEVPGTVVTNGMIVVEASYTSTTITRDLMLRPSYHFDKVTESFSVPTDYLVELRNRTDKVPKKNRKVRRREKFIADNWITNIYKKARIDQW